MTISTIESVLLADVCGGGPNTTTTTNGRTTRTSERSDYAYCVDNVRDNCRAANPGVLWGTNESAAARCQLDNQPKQCGTPPPPAKETP